MASFVLTDSVEEELFGTRLAPDTKSTDASCLSKQQSDSWGKSESDGVRVF